MKNPKPVVNFTHDAVFVTAPMPAAEIPVWKDYVDAEGNFEYAWVYTLDHPILGADKVRTSFVVKKYANGNFDTKNTRYKKVLDKT
jgi:hypothetical protein